MGAGTVVIVGASHAAVQAIDTLRREGHEGRIVLVGDEPHLPYNRPPLSKKYLSGEMERDRLYLRSSQFYEQSRTEVRLGLAGIEIPDIVTLGASLPLAASRMRS